MTMIRTKLLPRAKSSFVCIRCLQSKSCDDRIERVAWSYPGPTARFAGLRDHFAFYLPLLDAGWVDDERAEPQPGGFYGGWITSDLAGPFKGGPGSSGW